MAQAKQRPAGNVIELFEPAQMSPPDSPVSLVGGRPSSADPQFPKNRPDEDLISLGSTALDSCAQELRRLQEERGEVEVSLKGVDEVMLSLEEFREQFEEKADKKHNRILVFGRKKFASTAAVAYELLLKLESLVDTLVQDPDLPHIARDGIIEQVESLIEQAHVCRGKKLLADVPKALEEVRAFLIRYDVDRRERDCRELKAFFNPKVSNRNVLDPKIFLSEFSFLGQVEQNALFVLLLSDRKSDRELAYRVIMESEHRSEPFVARGLEYCLLVGLGGVEALKALGYVAQGSLHTSETLSKLLDFPYLRDEIRLAVGEAFAKVDPQGAFNRFVEILEDYEANDPIVVRSALKGLAMLGEHAVEATPYLLTLLGVYDSKKSTNLAEPHAIVEALAGIADERYLGTAKRLFRTVLRLNYLKCLPFLMDYFARFGDKGSARLLKLIRGRRFALELREQAELTRDLIVQRLKDEKESGVLPERLTPFQISR